MIIIGYQGIGKSTICKNNPKYIDFESSALKVDGCRLHNWQIPYCQMAIWLSQQGYVVFTSSHKEVREILKDCCEYCVAIIPSKELKKQWISLEEETRNGYHISSDMKNGAEIPFARDLYKEIEKKFFWNRCRFLQNMMEKWPVPHHTDDKTIIVAGL